MNKQQRAQSSLHDWFVRVIRESGLSAREVAEGTGIDETSLSHMRTGRRPVSERTAVRVARYLGIRLPDAMHVEREEDKPKDKGTETEQELRRLRQELNDLSAIVMRLMDRMDRVVGRIDDIERSRRHG
jgi:plasmid maintenance system antidote protein VapI